MGLFDYHPTSILVMEVLAHYTTRLLFRRETLQRAALGLRQVDFNRRRNSISSVQVVHMQAHNALFTLRCSPKTNTNPVCLVSDRITHRGAHDISHSSPRLRIDLVVRKGNPDPNRGLIRRVRTCFDVPRAYGRRQGTQISERRFDACRGLCHRISLSYEYERRPCAGPRDRGTLPPAGRSAGSGSGRWRRPSPTRTAGTYGLPPSADAGCCQSKLRWCHESD